MTDIQSYLTQNHTRQVDDLRRLVALKSITPGENPNLDGIRACADLVKTQMTEAGLRNVALFQYEGAHPYVYGDYLEAGPGKPTVFLYAHYDVQPVAGFEDQWKSDPWTLTARGGRLYGRGSADDKGAISAQLGSLAAWLKTRGKLPVNVKMVVEGEEEIGSANLQGFFEQYKAKLQSDVIVVCDTGNLEVGQPCLTYSLRGIVAAVVEVEGLDRPVHSGGGGGLVPDAAIGLSAVLGRLYWGTGRLPIPGFYDQVKPLTAAEKAEYRKLAPWESQLKEEVGLPAHLQFIHPADVTPFEQNWRQPAVTVIAQEASSFANASNQVLPKARAIVSVRIVPDQDPDEVFRRLQAFLTKDPPWGMKVTVKPYGGPVKWWMTDPAGPAFDAARQALATGFGKAALSIGCGGTIGFVGPLAELFGGAPALLLGIEDPHTGAHGPNESLHEGDFQKLTAALAHLYENLGQLPGGKVK